MNTNSKVTARIDKIVKSILSFRMTEDEWQKYYKLHPLADKSNHLIVPNTFLQKHTEQPVELNKEEIEELRRRVNDVHKYITPLNIRSAENGIDDAKKNIDTIRKGENIVNQNNGISVHITADDAKELEHCCREEGKHNLYQIAAFVTSNIDTIFKNSVFIMRNESKPEKEERNKKQGRAVFLGTEIYNGACKVNKETFSVLFTVGISRFCDHQTGKLEVKRRLYHFRLTNIKKTASSSGAIKSQ